MRIRNYILLLSLGIAISVVCVNWFNNNSISQTVGINNSGVSVDADGNTTITGTAIFRAGTTVAGTAPAKLPAGTLLTVPEIGALESTTSGLFFTTLGDRRSLMQVSQPIVTSVTVANTLDETTVYTTSLAAGELITGETIRTFASGVISTHDAADVVTFRVKVAGTTILTVTSNAGLVTNEPWRLEPVFTVRSIGNPGTVQAYAEFSIVNVNKSTANISTVSINTTIVSDITITLQWSEAQAGNTITISQGFSEILW